MKILFLCLAFLPASLAIFDLTNGITNTIALSGVGSTSFTTLSGGSLALGGGAFLTPAGAAVGLLGAGLVGAAVLAAASRRGKRSAADIASLQLIDSYFMTILDVDVDDCGKRLVCEIRTLEASERSDEENIISSLFDSSAATIDPLSAKAEYDIAAFIGDNYDKLVCARRYHRCQYERKVILQALKKLEKTTPADARPEE